MIRRYLRPISVGTIIAASAALLLLAPLSASSSFAQQMDLEAMQHCAALTNMVRRVTCYDLMVQLRITRPPLESTKRENWPLRPPL
jgi:hypothetical protein